MSKAICTATIKLNTKEVLKCINTLKEFLFAGDSVDDLENPDKEGYYKLLKDFEKIYEDMLAKEDQGVTNE